MTNNTRNQNKQTNIQKNTSQTIILCKKNINSHIINLKLILKGQISLQQFKVYVFKEIKLADCFMVTHCAEKWGLSFFLFAFGLTGNHTAAEMS